MNTHTLKNARTLALKLKSDNNARATALVELNRIEMQLEDLVSSNQPPLWKKRRRAQLIFEQATAKRFVSSCH